MWTYHDAAGNSVGLVVRWDQPEGKVIRPAARHGDGWRIGAMPDPRPLYALPELTQATRVVVVEGEKAVDAARGIGLVATTSVGGAKAAAKTDWSPLAGKETWVLPDADKSGAEYAETVAALLAGLLPAPTVKVLDPSYTYERDDLPKGFDIADAVAEREDHDERVILREVIEAVAAKTAPWRPSNNALHDRRRIPATRAQADRAGLDSPERC